MKGLSAVASAVVVCVLLAPATAGARIGDSAQGRGTDVSLGRFTFTADGFGIGSQATGAWKHTFSQAQGHATLVGQVTCLVVVGNSAGIGGFITNSGLPSVSPGNGFFLEVRDNADPGEGADRYSFITTPSTGLCGIVGAVGSPIVRGDIDVIASTFPT